MLEYPSLPSLPNLLLQCFVLHVGLLAQIQCTVRHVQTLSFHWQHQCLCAAPPIELDAYAAMQLSTRTRCIPRTPGCYITTSLLSV